MTEYERGFIDGIKSKVSAELTPTLINVSKTMLEMLKPVISTALENALNDNNVTNAAENTQAADVQPVNQWISVKDRLPEAVEEDVNGKIAFSEFVLVYLVYDNGFTYITNDKCRVDNKSWLHEIPGEGCKVTHWQPLPEPPKDGDTDA